MTSTPLAVENPATVTAESFLNLVVAEDRETPVVLLFSSKKSANTFRYRCYAFRASMSKMMGGTSTAWNSVSLIVEETEGTWKLTAYTDDSFLGIIAQGSPDEMDELARKMAKEKRDAEPKELSGYELLLQQRESLKKTGSCDV